MSALSSSELPSLSSEDLSRRHADALSRLRIRLIIDQSCAALVASEVVRLMARFMPNIAHFLTVDSDAITIRMRQGGLEVRQTDLLVTRLARTQGISHVSATLKVTATGIVYGAEMRGRSRTVPVRI